MYATGDTIAAVSSPAGTGARHIIRLAGSQTRRILEGLLGRHSLAWQRCLYRATINTAGIAVPCCIYLFPGPHSYTGDDIAELHLAVNQAVTASILETVVSAGARIAEPGEFTARAYLNGKMDLVQAEAVAGMVAAASRTQLAAAERLLEGRLSATIADIRDGILELVTLIEASLDFSEDDIDFITSQQAAEQIAGLSGSIENLLSGAIRYEAMLDLPTVAIAGRTNAGKSSLLNALLGKERAIVSDEPATTRDVLSDLLHLDSADCIIFDCAGLSARPHGIIDELAQEAAVRAINSADCVLFCCDVSREDRSADEELFAQFAPSTVIRVATKADLCHEPPQGFAAVTSAITGQGIAELKQHIAEMLRSRPAAEGLSQIALNERHSASLRSALEDLYRATAEIRQNCPEAASMFLRNAWNNLGPVSSEPLDEAVLNGIFSRFCIGK